MRRLRLVALAFAVTAMALTLTACGATGDGDEDGEVTLDLTIGDLVPLTGDLADLGPSGRKAADIAIDEINTAIDDVGADHKVTIQHEDEGRQSDAAISAARKLADEGVSCIAGAWESTNTLAVAESVSIPEGILEISPASASTELTSLDDEGLINRTVPADNLEASASTASSKSEPSTAFDELFASSAPKDVDRQRSDAQNFDAVILCYLAAVAARSTEGADMALELGDLTGPDGDEYTWEELPEAIEALQSGDDIDYIGASGEIDLDVNGDPTVGTYDPGGQGP